MPDEVTFANDLYLIERVSTILELVEWRWTVSQVLEQPDTLLDDIIRYKGLVGKIKRQVDGTATAGIGGIKPGS